MDMKEQAEKFRKAVLERGGVGPRARYTAEQRQEAVERAQGRGGELVVHGPGGVRVEGLSLEDAVRLLRGLL